MNNLKFKFFLLYKTMSYKVIDTMKIIFNSWFAAWITMVIPLHALSQGQSGMESTLNDLLRQIGEAKRTMYKAEARATARLRVVDVLQQNTVLNSEVHRVLVKGEQYILETSSQSDKPTGQLLYGKNNRYRFVLVRKTSQEGWILRDCSMEQGDSSTTSKTGQTEPMETLVREAVNPWLIPTPNGNIHFSAEEVNSIPGFEIQSIDLEGSTPKVSFTYILDSKHPIVTRCSVVFDANKFFIPINIEIHDDDVASGYRSSKISNREVEVINSRSIKVTFRSEIKTQFKDTKIHTLADYSTTIHYERVPESEFRLTAFGLPEPVGVVWEKKTPVYVWLLVAAGVLGLLALLFRWLAHRRQRHRNSEA
jgi:hypothetical protein